MQNDPLYNKIMKKIFIIEVTSETPDGEVDPVAEVTYFNMAPDEVMAPGNLPLIGFSVWKDKDNLYTGYETIEFVNIADDRSEAAISTSSSLSFIADLTNNVWKLQED